MIQRIKSSLKRRLGRNRFHSIIPNSVDRPKCLLAYLPVRQQGWILDFLWKDLCQRLILIPGLESGIASSPQDLASKSCGKDVFVIAMGLKHLNELIEMGFPPERIVFYHTHVRLGLAIKKLDLLHAILVLNGFERELIAMRKVQRDRIHLFPAGYDESLFSPPDCQAERSIDVLFVGRYRRGKDGYYHQRKRYSFQVKLAHQLLDQGKNVAFLGNDWEECEYSLDTRLQLFNVEHLHYGEIYRQARLVCSVAGQEGGPVSFLEGMACGCLMVSSPTGFTTDLNADQVACWTLPLVDSANDWADSIQHILAHNSSPTSDQQLSRESYLDMAKFSSLALQLVEICWPRADA